MPDKADISPASDRVCHGGSYSHQKSTIRTNHQKSTINQSPPFIRELKALEVDLYELLASVKFRRIPNVFLDKLD
jgi:hypothetical protein